MVSASLSRVQGSLTLRNYCCTQMPTEGIPSINKQGDIMGLIRLQVLHTQGIDQERNHTSL